MVYLRMNSKAHHRYQKPVAMRSDRVFRVKLHHPVAGRINQGRERHRCPGDALACCIASIERVRIVLIYSDLIDYSLRFAVRVNAELPSFSAERSTSDAWLAIARKMIFVIPGPAQAPRIRKRRRQFSRTISDRSQTSEIPLWSNPGRSYQANRFDISGC